MQSRFKKALEPMTQNAIICAGPNIKRRNNVLTISKKNYRLKNKTIQTYEQNNCPKPNTLVLTCILSYQHRNLCKIKIPTNIKIKNLSEFLIKNKGGNEEFAFIQIRKQIYANNQINFDEESHFNLRSMDCTLENIVFYPLLDFFFFDGDLKNYMLKVLRISYEDDENCSVLEWFERGIICKGCEKNMSVVIVDNNPILPENDNHLCYECHDELFLDENGNVRYKDMISRRI
ncbi:hypothetical protein COBT_001851 [Conglomerata obtusa]